MGSKFGLDTGQKEELPERFRRPSMSKAGCVREAELRLKPEKEVDRELLKLLPKE